MKSFDSIVSFVSAVDEFLAKKNAKLGKKYSMQINGNDPHGFPTTGILTDTSKLAAVLADSWAGYSKVNVCLYSYKGRTGGLLLELVL